MEEKVSVITPPNAERNLSSGKVMIDDNEHNVTDFEL